MSIEVLGTWTLRVSEPYIQPVGFEVKLLGPSISWGVNAEASILLFDI